MKSKIILAIALSLALSSCNGQTKNEKDTPDHSIKPLSNIKVNKQYDDHGNLIRYDSTYSYYWGNAIKDSTRMDSIFHNFRRDFLQKYPFSNEPLFNDFFFQDSLLKYDFYKKDFFLKRFQDNMERMDSLFGGMDSFKNNFFGKQFNLPGHLSVPKNK